MSYGTCEETTRPMDPMAPGFHFGSPEVQAVMLATAIISAIAAIRYRRGRETR